MYIAVIKPALPTVVNPMPSCCNALATASAAPTTMPPTISVRLSLGYVSAARPLFFCLALLNAISGSSAIPAASDLSVLNAYALIESPPIAWNTKAVPQMSATNTNIKLLCICFPFMR